MQVKAVNTDSIADILLGRAGLIAGPGVTVNSNLYRALADDLGVQFAEAVRGLRSLGDQLRQSGLDESGIKDKLRDSYSEQTRSPYLSTLAKPNWKAIISISLDSHLEDRVQTEIDKKPSRRPLTRISDFMAQVPPRCTPAFELLGSLSSEDFPLYEEEYLASRVTWRHALVAFCDLLAGSPAICLGLDADTPAFMDLVSEMLAAPNTRPASLVLMADSPLVTNQSLLRLLANKVPVYSFADSLSSLISRISSQERVGRTPLLKFREPGESLMDRYQDVCIIVEEPDRASVDKIPQEALLDSLFSPSLPDWAPYTAELDFRRDVEDQVLKLIKQASRENYGSHACIAVGGSAANGKTTLLKRVALELVASERTAIWVTATPLTAPERFFHEFFRDLKGERPTGGPVFVFIDDPTRSRSGEVNHILGSAASFGFYVTLIVGVRSSEWSSTDESSIAGHSTPVTEVVLQDDFSSDEIEKLRPYLVKIGLVASETKAAELLSQIDVTHARDVLNTLYVAVPHTRSIIVSSVRDEYCRLGDLRGLRKAVKGAYDVSTAHVREAYEFTAIANTYGCDLPFEILRSAVGFEWNEAGDLLANNSAVWGVLYTIESDDGITMRARNQIVADAIVTLVNSGSHSRSGEIRGLHCLINACNGKTGLTYRNFIAKLLIGNATLGERLHYDDGRELYATAVASLAAPDRALVHHQGIWEERHHNSDEAIQIYRTALATPNYPYTERGESDSNIYTSMASAVLSQMKSGDKSVNTGRVEAEELLAKARQTGIADAHAVHVSANLSLELVRTLKDDEQAEKLQIACAAVSDIDKIAILDDSPIAAKRRSKKSEGLLQSARESLYDAALPKADAERFAEDMWESSRTQDGFVVVARKRLAEVRENPKGSKYKGLYDYILSCRERVRDEGKYIDKRLSEIQTEVFYWWRIHRAMLSPIDLEIDWSELLTLLSEVGIEGHTTQHRFFQFLGGVALAHLGDWDAANAVFATLRQSDLPPNVLWLPRAYLLNARGGRTTVQGVVREYGGSTYLEVEQVGQSIRVERKDRWCSPGETDHANVMFCFGGARAVHDT